jgi:hypothetical protein
MNIEFNVGLADIEAFNTFMLNHSPIAKQMWRRNKIIALVCVAFGILSLVWAGVAGRFSPVPSTILIVLTIGMVIYAFSLKRIALHRQIKRIREVYSKNNTSLGKQKCSISPQSLNYVNSAGEFSVKWDLFNEVINAGNYIFIVTPLSGGDFIIPRNAFPDESSFNELYITIKKYHQDALSNKQSI